MAFQYREALKGRGLDREELKKRSEERLRLAKARRSRSEGNSNQRRRSVPFPKRDAHSMDASQMAGMDMELPEEAQAELLRLETEMALVRQKYNQSKDRSQ